MSDLMAAFVVSWMVISITTILARMAEVDNQPAGAVAAGVLWPIYLPYRLALIVWTFKP